MRDRYLTEEGYNIIPISREHQLEYGINCLNLGDSNVIACHAEAARQIVRSPHFHGNVQLVEFGAVASMFGALHCSSQVVRRVPSTHLGGAPSAMEAPLVSLSRGVSVRGASGSM